MAKNLYSTLTLTLIASILISCLKSTTVSDSTWKNLSTDTIIHGEMDWSSIAMSSDGSKLALVESRGHLYTSTDFGTTWTDRSISDSAIAGDKNWYSVAMSSDGSKLAAVVYEGHLYASADFGTTWRRIEVFTTLQLREIRTGIPLRCLLMDPNLPR